MFLRGWRDDSGKKCYGLAENSDSVPSTQMANHNFCTSRSRGSSALFWPEGSFLPPRTRGFVTAPWTTDVHRIKICFVSCALN